MKLVVYICDLCSHEMDERHCKLIYPQCGYTRDCSDPVKEVS